MKERRLRYIASFLTLSCQIFKQKAQKTQDALVFGCTLKIDF